MNKKEQINKLIDEALNSVDNISRAEAKPYLLTRIHARMRKGTESAWEKAGWFIGRPAVAFAGLCILVLINVTAVMFSRPTVSNTVSERSPQNPSDEFSYTVATIYEVENAQP
ncbi:MAG: hypothetical protein ABI666_06620 [Ferruginibacter sp.]